ncbi:MULTISPECIES: YncE family protein [Streptosporangium]|uniref:DNA-binding beta-propeller fold protein YncE n=1 Tax=Streptosporangium brasiliense TaxID=47480 RepID=A0ABT9RJD3_9ACTN|nr:YncE family protein [Streptosporangium brasiliense]MDP9869399.1 DNA-binding beta-propeller fold protein YncE [Streptosporangium brasiliense]
MTYDARAGREGDVLAVVSQSGPTVSFFDAADHRLLGVLDVLAEPHELCLDPARRLLWCTHSYHAGYYHANNGRRSEITLIDPGERRIVDVIDLTPEHAPHGLAIDAARDLLYVSVEGAEDRPGAVMVVDLATRKPIGRIGTGAKGPHWFVISPDGNTGYASNKEAPYVSVVDLRTGTMTAKVEVPGSEGLAVSGDGGKVFVAAPYGSFAAPGAPAAPGIRVIDTATASITEVLPTGAVTFPVHVTTTGQLLTGELRMEPAIDSRLGRQAPGRLTVFDAHDHRPLGSIEVGHFPLTITSSPDGRLGYVSCVSSSTVDIVDLEEMRRLEQLKIPKRGEPGAHGLAYIPRQTS